MKNNDLIKMNFYICKINKNLRSNERIMLNESKQR